MADFSDRFAGTRDDDTDADIQAALASYNDRSKSMAERVGLSSSYAPEDQPQQSAQSRRLSPQSTEIAQLPPVTPPNLQNMPDPSQYGMGPNQQQESPFKVFFNPMVLLAAGSSLLTRRPLMAAMSYATGAMNGFQQGQNEVFEQNKSKFQEALRETIAQNQTELNRYKAAWDTREELKNENFAKLYTASQLSKDEVGAALLRSGKIDEFIKHKERMETAQTHLEQAIQLQQIRDQMIEDRTKRLMEERYGGNRAQQADKIADGIENGTQPPTLTGLYGEAPAVRSRLEDRKFPLAQAQLEFDAAKKQILSLNGPQMTRYVGLAKGVTATIDRVNELAQEMKLSGIPALNKLELQGYINTQGNSPNGQLATSYMTQVGILKEEFANLANGGYAPTEPAWKLADQQINGNYGVDQLGASLKEVKRAINYRLFNIPGMQQMGPGSPNRYAPQQPQQPQQTAPDGIIRYDSQGNRVQ